MPLQPLGIADLDQAIAGWNVMDSTAPMILSSTSRSTDLQLPRGR